MKLHKFLDYAGLGIALIIIIMAITNPRVFMNKVVRADLTSYSYALEDYEQAEKYLFLAREAQLEANANLHAALDVRHTAFCDLALVKHNQGDKISTPINKIKEVCVNEKYSPLFKSKTLPSLNEGESRMMKFYLSEEQKKIALSI